MSLVHLEIKLCFIGSVKMFHSWFYHTFFPYSPLATREQQKLLAHSPERDVRKKEPPLNPPQYLCPHTPSPRKKCDFLSTRGMNDPKNSAVCYAVHMR